MTRSIVPVILSGGAGTRLWPLSTADRPKQFHALTGAETMLQMTARRVADRSRFSAPIVVASADHADEVERQLAEVGLDDPTLILEPVGRNTAAAIALAALETDAHDLLLVMPSDHVISRPERFVAAVDRAAAEADQGWLMTFGISPDRPETGYGYVRRGAPLADGVFAVDRFVEKPDLETAKTYLEEGGYDWNGGIFLFQAAEIILGFGKYAPDIFTGTEAAMVEARREGNRIAPDPTRFSGIRSESIDHALMEKHNRVAVVPVEMGWSDVGSWDALYDIGEKDSAGNSLAGRAVPLDTSGCLVRSTGPTVVTVGVADLIVVATGDTVLVLPRGESQRVREAVETVRRADG